MTGMISPEATLPDAASLKRASANLACLMTHVANLYCAGGASSVSFLEARELAMSVSYVLGIADATPEEAAAVLNVQDPISLWHNG